MKSTRPNKNKSNITTFKILTIFLLVSIVFVMFVGGVKGYSCVDETTCQNTINAVTSGTIYVANDFNISSGLVFNSKQSIVFDCQGHRIGSSNPDAGNLIFIHIKDSSYITVKNCILDGYPYDGYYEVSNGIKIEGGKNNLIAYNEITDIMCTTKENGVYIYGSSNNFIIHNYIHNVGKWDNYDAVGIHIYGGSSEDNVIENNVVTNCKGHGIYVDDSTLSNAPYNTTIDHSYICDSGVDDLHLDMDSDGDVKVYDSYFSKLYVQSDSITQDGNKGCSQLSYNNCLIRETGLCSRYPPARGSNFKYPSINFCAAVPDECVGQAENHIFYRNGVPYNCEGCGGWHQVDCIADNDCSSGQTCQNGQCVGGGNGCTSDSECGQDYCDNSNGNYIQYNCDYSNGNCFTTTLDCNVDTYSNIRQVCCDNNCGIYSSTSETTCNDGIDNDCDGLIDCADSDCFSFSYCQAQSSCAVSSDYSNLNGRRMTADKDYVYSLDIWRGNAVKDYLHLDRFDILSGSTEGVNAGPNEVSHYYGNDVSISNDKYYLFISRRLYNNEQYDNISIIAKNSNALYKKFTIDLGSLGKSNYIDVAADKQSKNNAMAVQVGKTAIKIWNVSESLSEPQIVCSSSLDLYDIYSGARLIKNHLFILANATLYDVNLSSPSTMCDYTTTKLEDGGFLADDNSNDLTIYRQIGGFHNIDKIIEINPKTKEVNVVNNISAGLGYDLSGGYDQGLLYYRSKSSTDSGTVSVYKSYIVRGNIGDHRLFALDINCFEPKQASHNITSCQSIISPGTYNLTQNIIDSDNQTCINIAADNVVLDCQGHKVWGNGQGVSNISKQTKGIYVSGNYVLIKNCNVSGWTFGIFTDSNQSSIYYNKIGYGTGNAKGNAVGMFLHFNNMTSGVKFNDIYNSTTMGGIVVSGGGNVGIGHNKLTHNANNGIYISHNTISNTVWDNTITDTYNGDGIYLRNATSNHVFNNTVTYSSNSGILVEGIGSTDNNVSFNKFCYNNNYDMELLKVGRPPNSNTGFGNICDNNNWNIKSICTSPCPTQVTLTASWLPSEIEIGESVNAIAEAQNVNDGENINFKIYKHRCSSSVACDGGGTTNAIRTFFGYITGYVIGSCVDDLVNQSIVDLSKGVASYEWTPTQISDDTNLCNYYFFTATLDGKTATSGQLEVFKKGQLPNRPPVARIVLPNPSACDSQSSEACCIKNGLSYYQFAKKIYFNQTSYDPDGNLDSSLWTINSTLINEWNTSYTYQNNSPMITDPIELFVNDTKGLSDSEGMILSIINCTNPPSDLPPQVWLIEPQEDGNYQNNVNFKVIAKDDNGYNNLYFIWEFNKVGGDITTVCMKNNNKVKIECSDYDSNNNKIDGSERDFDIQQWPNFTMPFYSSQSGQYHAYVLAVDNSNNWGMDGVTFNVTPTQTCECSHGTPCGQCSSSKPEFCTWDKELIDNCNECSCPAGNPVCTPTGSCTQDNSGTCQDREDEDSCNSAGGCFWDNCKSCSDMSPKECATYKYEKTCNANPCYDVVIPNEIENMIPNNNNPSQYQYSNPRCEWNSTNNNCLFAIDITQGPDTWVCQKRVEVLQECTDVIHERRVNETYWINETGGWQLDDKGKCGQTQVKTTTCPQTPGQQLPFFDWRNVIAAVLILAGYYSFMLAKRKNKKLKVSKRR